MDDLHRALAAAWLCLRPILLRDPAELHRRLARRRLPLLQRPPRAWCLALRASDHRLTPLAAPSPIHQSPIINHHSPPSPIHPSSFRPHPFPLSLPILRRLAWPILLPAPGLPARDVARQLGVTPAGLLTARLAGRFHTRHIPPTAGRGKPVPILYTRDPLDPQARTFAPPDPLWGWTAQYLVDRLDDENFTPQTLTRIRVYRPISDIYRRLRAQSPEQAEKSPPRRSRKLPPPAPDSVWYKWSHTGQYLGDNPRFWRKSPHDPGDPTRAAAARASRAAATSTRARKARAQDLRRQFRAMEDAFDDPDPDDETLNPDDDPRTDDDPTPAITNPPLSSPNAEPRTPKPPHSRNTALFNGHAWLCPACHKTCRTLYLPVPPPPLDAFLTPPPGHPGSKKLARLIAAAEFVDENHPDQLPPPLNCFACSKCHRVNFQSRLDPNMWNEFIAYLSGGLLYGREVERPSWFTRDRKRPYKPQSNRPAPRRAQIERRLLNGWSRAQIARDLCMSINAINLQCWKIYRQHGVHTHKDLLRKHKRPPAAHLIPRAEQVRRHIHAGLSQADIAARMGITKSAVQRYTWQLRKSGQLPRPPRKRDAIAALLQQGLPYKTIAHRLSLRLQNVYDHAHALRHAHAPH